MNTQNPITHACRLLREAADEIQQGHTLSSNRADWTGEPEAKAAFDEHHAAADALEALAASLGAGGASPWTGAAGDAAAKALAECMDYPWEHMPEAGRQAMREHAQKVLSAAVAGSVEPTGAMYRAAQMILLPTGDDGGSIMLNTSQVRALWQVMLAAATSIKQGGQHGAE